MKKHLHRALPLAAVLLAVILLFGGKSQGTAAATSAVSANDDRVKFLESFGWQVTPAPTEASQVRIPEESGEMFRRYNALQKGQGYDLSKYSGKKVMRYVYEILNYPDAASPVYASILVYEGHIIGGDITNTAPDGKIHGFAMPTSPSATTPTEPEESTDGSASSDTGESTEPAEPSASSAS